MTGDPIRDAVAEAGGDLDRLLELMTPDQREVFIDGMAETAGVSRERIAQTLSTLTDGGTPTRWPERPPTAPNRAQRRASTRRRRRS